jgi:hypothetical protein
MLNNWKECNKMTTKTKTTKTERDAIKANKAAIDKRQKKPTAAQKKAAAELHKLAGPVLTLLKSAVLATRHVSEEQQKLGEERKGAYALYVQAAREAGKAEVLEAASVDLFRMIRETGQIDGQSLNCKRNKDGSQYIVPSAISAAKSVLTAALTGGVELEEEGEPRSFRAIRTDVQEIARKAREKDLKGIELVRVEARMRLAELADLIANEENEADLADLVQRVNVAMKDYGFVSPEDRQEAEEGEGDADMAELMDAAAIGAAAAVKAVQESHKTTSTVTAKPDKVVRRHRAHGPRTASM